MVQKCCVHCCKSVAKKGSNIGFHKFPSNSEMRKLWMVAIDITESDLLKNKDLRVCSNHFTANDYILGVHMKLKQKAVPKKLPVGLNNNGNKENTLPVKECNNVVNVSLSDVNEELRQHIVKLENDELEIFPIKMTVDEDPLEINEKFAVFAPSEGEQILLQHHHDELGIDKELKFEILEHQLQEKEKMMNTLQNRIDVLEQLKKNYETCFTIISNSAQDNFLKSTQLNKESEGSSGNMINKGLELLMSCGSKEYEEMRRLQPSYPSISTLQYCLQNFKFESGALYDVFVLSK